MFFLLMIAIVCQTAHAMNENNDRVVIGVIDNKKITVSCNNICAEEFAIETEVLASEIEKRIDQYIWTKSVVERKQVCSQYAQRWQQLSKNICIHYLCLSAQAIYKKSSSIFKIIITKIPDISDVEFAWRVEGIEQNDIQEKKGTLEQYLEEYGADNSELQEYKQIIQESKKKAQTPV